VGLPSEVEWQDKTVRIAVCKRPIVRRVMAGRLNIDGDVKTILRVTAENIMRP